MVLGLTGAPEHFPYALLPTIPYILIPLPQMTHFPGKDLDVLKLSITQRCLKCQPKLVSRRRG